MHRPKCNTLHTKQLQSSYDIKKAATTSRDIESVAAVDWQHTCRHRLFDAWAV